MSQVKILQVIARQYLLLINKHKIQFKSKIIFEDSLTQYIVLSQGNMSLGNMSQRNKSQGNTNKVKSYDIKSSI